MLVKEEITYQEGSILFKGYLSYLANSNQPKPCVLIAHDWEGRHQGMCDIADKIAMLGYVGFAVDMYGDGKLGATNDERRQMMAPLMANRKNIYSRMLAALNAVKNHQAVLSHKIASIGYCFGGLCSLDLARGGADILGAVSFHGLLSAPESPVCANIQSKVLVHHGYDDPLVPKNQIQEFSEEMTDKRVDWQVHLYGLVQHSFTNPNAHDEQMGLFYDKQADNRSWQTTVQFLKSILS